MTATIEALDYTTEQRMHMLSIMRHHGLHSWSLRITRSKATLGQCRYALKQIDVSKYQPDGCYMDTLLHEIAHALTPHHGHDEVWKAKCIEIGAVPVECAQGTHRTHHLYAYSCSHCGAEVKKSFGKLRKPEKYWSRCCYKPIALARRPTR